MMGLFKKPRHQALETRIESVKRVEESGGDLKAALAKVDLTHDDYIAYQAKVEAKPDFTPGLSKPAPNQDD